MIVNVELGNDEVRGMLIERLRELMPDVAIDVQKIQIKVKSKQNFRNHEWEDGEVKLEYKNIT